MKTWRFAFRNGGEAMDRDDFNGNEESGPHGLRVSESLLIPASELEVRASRSGGPGGQHVNTSSTRVEIVWNVRSSSALDDIQRLRLEKALGAKLSSHGALRIVASDTRSQRQNRALAEERLIATVKKGLMIKKPRKRTRPHRGAVEQRLLEKKLRASRKRDRRPPGEE
jgi:ribosome-associated protein